MSKKPQQKQNQRKQRNQTPANHRQQAGDDSTNELIYFLSQAATKKSKLPLEAKSEAQGHYMMAIESKPITFGLGPAGTGKTYVATAMACDALINKEVETIYVTRPIFDDEDIGFLPGDENEKFAPYFLPVREVMEERLGAGFTEYLIKQGRIKIAPFAFMRGRAEPVNSLLPTPDGYRKMGDLKVGEFVYGSDGKPTRITGVFPQGKKSVADVKFSDGSVVRCSHDHLWDTRTTTQRNRNQPFVTKTTAEIQRSVRNKHGHKNHEIPVLSAPVEIANRAVPIDPYLLGCLLGDGTVSNGSIHFCTADVEIVDYISKVLPDNIHIKKNKSSVTGYDYYICGDSSAKNPIKDALRGLGVWGSRAHEKSIPELYMNNSEEVRIGVLRGLMDTDGSVFAHRSDKSRVQFYSCSHKLTSDVKWLVESLGGVARMRLRVTPKEGTHTSGFGHNLDMNVLDIVLPSSVNPFRLPRKAEKFVPCRLMRLIEDVVDAGEEECQCISVEAENSLYLTGNFIVTHNTFKNAFVILDEAQNTTPKQMKTFLTRIGENSTVVINGDSSQQDIRATVNGLDDAYGRFWASPYFGSVVFDNADVRRSALVEHIVERYNEAA